MERRGGGKVLSSEKEEVDKDLSWSCREEDLINLSAEYNLRGLQDWSFRSLKFGDDTEHTLELEIASFGRHHGDM